MKTFKEYYNENFDPTTLLDFAMNQVQQGGADLRTIRRTLIMLSNDPQQKEYLASDQFVHDLEAKLDLSDQEMGIHGENFKDGKKKGKSRPGRVKRAGASCSGSVTSLRKKAKSGGEKGKMYHWCANMKSGKKKK